MSLKKKIAFETIIFKTLKKIFLLENSTSNVALYSGHALLLYIQCFHL